MPAERRLSIAGITLSRKRLKPGSETTITRTFGDLGAEFGYKRTLKIDSDGQVHDGDNVHKGDMIDF